MALWQYDKFIEMIQEEIGLAFGINVLIGLHSVSEYKRFQNYQCSSFASDNFDMLIFFIPDNCASVLVRTAAHEIGAMFWEQKIIICDTEARYHHQLNVERSEMDVVCHLSISDINKLWSDRFAVSTDVRCKSPD